MGSRISVFCLALLLATCLALFALAPALAEEQPAGGTAVEGEPASEPSGDTVDPGAQGSGTTLQAVTGLSAPPALGDFQDINLPGFGNPDNRYSWSMVNFKGKIYVGTWNLRTPLSIFQLVLGFFSPGFLAGTTSGTEVWRYDGGPLGRTWTRVVDNGLGDIDNMGLRNMVVWDDPDDVPDRGPAIYGTTINLKDGLEVWRTFDGTNWEVVVGRGAKIGNGFGHGAANESGRGMLAVGDHLYVGAMRVQGGQIWRTANGVDWELVTSVQKLETGPFGWIYNMGSLAMADMCLFDDDGDGAEELFVGTWRLFGFSIYKYDFASGKWSRVAEFGIRKGSNIGVHQLVPFNGRIWVLTVNFSSGFDVYASRPANPAAGIRSNADWELVAEKGFTDAGNYYAWEGIVYPLGAGGEELPNSRLFIGTFNLSRGFYLYSVTRDGEWAVEVGRGSRVPNGISTALNYGVRTMALYQDKLVIGCAGMMKGTDVYLAW
ncbi:MAG: hypothetical protein H5T73_06885 [Actinobacteria bacterium]|nr:hypothetical protein [Actinomycetota bacterium]